MKRVVQLRIAHAHSRMHTQLGHCQRVVHHSISQRSHDEKATRIWSLRESKLSSTIAGGAGGQKNWKTG
jgi:tetrahydromethanopterin S-methyltransferase subunit H